MPLPVLRHEMLDLLLCATVNISLQQVRTERIQVNLRQAIRVLKLLPPFSEKPRTESKQVNVR